MECDDDAATFEADPLTDEDILAEFNHLADANEEEEEGMRMRRRTRMGL